MVLASLVEEISLCAMFGGAFRQKIARASKRLVDRNAVGSVGNLPLALDSE
jgi:hypothetical protein